MEITEENYHQTLQFLQYKTKSCHVLVVGDVMLDEYLYGDVERISPEAPVPINHILERKETLGGAANVAHNLAKLGCQSYIVGLIGNDSHANRLRRLMKNLSINDDGLIKGRNKTTTKIRVLGGHQQMVRLDFEENTPVSADIQKKIIEQAEEKIVNDMTAIVISDYNKGMCSFEVCQAIISLAHKNNKLVFIDPKGSSWDKYTGADYITPNVKELGDVLGHKIDNEDSAIKQASKFIMEKYQIHNLLVTRSEKGVSLFSDEQFLHIPTHAQEVYDVSGAGDTVISVFSAAISCNLSPDIAAFIANFAAGIGVSKSGTYPVGNEEILDRFKNEISIR
jgi:rfaE bifunctional protein kinase chain/domain